MPDILYKTVKSVTQPPRLVEVAEVTIVTIVSKVEPDGTRNTQPPQTNTYISEKWSVKAMVDTDYVGIEEEEFFFRSLAECEVIKPGHKRAF